MALRRLRQDAAARHVQQEHAAQSKRHEAEISVSRMHSSRVHPTRCHRVPLRRMRRTRPSKVPIADFAALQTPRSTSRTGVHEVLPQICNHRTEAERQTSSSLHVQRPAAFPQQRKVQAVPAKSWRKAVAWLQPGTRQSGNRRRLYILRADAREEAPEDDAYIAPSDLHHTGSAQMPKASPSHSNAEKEKNQTPPTKQQQQQHSSPATKTK